MLLGDLTLVTLAVVVVRRYYFGEKIRQLLKEFGAARRVARDIENEDKTHRSPRHDGHQSRSRFLDLHKEYTNLAVSHIAGYGSFPAPWKLIKYFASSHRSNKEN